MLDDECSYLERAPEYWEGGQAVKAGRLVFENLPNDLRPKWASRILRLVLERRGIRFNERPNWTSGILDFVFGRNRVQPSVFDEILYTAEHPAMCGNGHRVFDALRGATLELDRFRRTIGLTEEQTLRSSILSLAELVAKVTYNATNPRDEFDEDSGWWIVACLRGFVDHQWTDDEFSQAAWSAVCSRKG
jgi:hypothetical protein